MNKPSLPPAPPSTPAHLSSGRSARPAAVVLALMVGTSLLSACGRDDNRSAGHKLDAAVATTERKAGEVAADARQAGRDASQAVGAATESAAGKTRDAAITVEIKSRLARDEKLSALAINVDTDGGRVLLRGSAPDTAARNHAVELARTVDGVVEVRNELNIQPTSSN